MSLSDYLENALVNWLRGTAFPAAPATLYAALVTVNQGEANIANEVSGGSYARQPVTLGAPPASSAGAATVTNTTQVAFPAMPAATEVGVVLMDAAVGGNALAYDNSMADVTQAAGQRVVFDPGALSFGVD